jgi:hypothetical protein
VSGDIILLLGVRFGTEQRIIARCGAATGRRHFVACGRKRQIPRHFR